MSKEKKGFAESVDEVTDKIDQAAVKVENFFTKTISFFKDNWKWLLSDVASLGTGLLIGFLLF